MVCVAVVLAQYLRFGSTPTADNLVGHYETGYSAVLVVIWLATLAGLRTRSPKYIGAGIEEYRRVIAASFWTFGAVAIAELLLKLEVSRGYLAVALPVGIIGLVLSRWQWRGYVIRQRRAGNYQTAVLAIGDREPVANLAVELTSSSDYGYRVVGVVIPGYGDPCGEYLTINDARVPIVGGDSHILDAIRRLGADKVAIAGTDHFGVKGVRRLIWELEPMGVELVVDCVTDVALSLADGHASDRRPTAAVHLQLAAVPRREAVPEAGVRFQPSRWRRSPSTPASCWPRASRSKSAARVRSSTRPERIGIDGKPFMMLKFRTMVEDADKELLNLLSANESDGLLFKIRERPARDTGRAGSCAASASTSCRSSSTCCGRR